MTCLKIFEKIRSQINFVICYPGNWLRSIHAWRNLKLVSFNLEIFKNFFFFARSQCVSARFACLNPSTPKSDWHLISPYNVNPESNIKVMRIKEVITNLRWS